MKTIYFDNIPIVIGKNAQDNWDLLSKNPAFTWLHLKSFPSCHVIIESKSISNPLLEFAAFECKKHTKYRNLSNLKINYTLISNIQKADKIGSVTFKSNRKVNTISV
jgi:predicted ribosome quality control (RQC) complex YloA/Tae2 family protein